MKKRFLAVLLCVSMTAMMVVGCGNKEASATETKTTGDTDEKATGDVTGALKGVTIKIGTSGLFGPFSYYDADGKTLIGFDLDMIAALQEVLGFEIDGDIQAMDYSALTTSIAEGKLDMGAAALCATDERKKVMDFSDTYCDSGQQVMVNSEDDKGIKSVDDLAGKTVAVEKGTASHTYAAKELTDTKLEVHDTITTAYESLEQGKVDAIIQDGPGCAFYIKTTTDTKLKIVGDEFNQGQAPYAIAFVKGFKYVDEFNAALKMLTDNGKMDEIYTKWCK
ncbi:MAG: transporter substrate-binding domain-containing protein [Lachnospiraceae bacterium]|nr:transporter substrate-binding domain-containing protein [Lachnospiraceae bacterium]